VPLIAWKAKLKAKCVDGGKTLKLAGCVCVCVWNADEWMHAGGYC
jgi:hypothetical protein